MNQSSVPNYGQILTRQLDIIPMSVLGRRIEIIGAGAVGGWTAIALSKMGFGNIRIWDFDTVSVENLSPQAFRHCDLGKTKVDAIAEIVKAFSGFTIEKENRRYDVPVPRSGDIIITAVDSMAARKGIWETCKGWNVVFVDPRMGAEKASLYVMHTHDHRDIQSYEKTLHTDAEGLEEPCTAKATAYCALSLAGLVASQVKAIATKTPYRRNTHWDIPAGALQSWPGATG